MGIIYHDYKEYERIEFEVGGRASVVVKPSNPLPGNPWIWRAEFLGIFDQVDIVMLDMGWHIAYHCASDMYGCPESIGYFDEFYRVVVPKFELHPKTVLFGFSRGGLYSVNFAEKYPERVGALYLDGPVLDIKSWPGGMMNGNGSPHCWQECMAIYGLTEETAADFLGNPIDKAAIIAKDKIPVIIVAGGADTDVPYVENGKVFYERYQAVGDGVIESIVKPDCAHHPHSLDDPSPVIRFIYDHFYNGAN